MSLYFSDLSTNLVSFGNPTHLNNLDPATYVILFRPDRVFGATNGQTITKQDTTTNNGVVMGLRGQVEGITSYRALVNRTALMQVTLGVILTAKTWAFLAYTYAVAGTASINAFYALLDSPFKESTSTAILGSGAKLDDSAEPLQIGPKDAASDAAEASIAFLGIWGRILSLNELNNLRTFILDTLSYYPGYPVNTSNIPANNRLFTFPGSNGSTGRVIDWSPYANHGTPSGPIVGQDVPIIESFQTWRTKRPRIFVPSKINLFI